MLYLEYEEMILSYHETQKAYRDILDEKEELVARVLPKGIRYDADKIIDGSHGNAFEIYTEQIEQKHIDERIEAIRAILEDRLHLAMYKEQELRKSNDLHDRIYICKYLDHGEISKFAQEIGYSKSQVYRIIETIDQNIAKMRQNAKKDLIK